MHLQLSPPKRINTLLELRAPFDWLTVAAALPRLLTKSKGDRRPILLLPGYMTDENSMQPLKQYLKYLNYTVYDWGLGKNLGNIEADVELVGQRLRVLREEHNLQPFTLIGWSLGGVVARELTRLYSDDVREVITMGTPITGGPKYTVAGQQFAKAKGIDLDIFEDYVFDRNCLGFSQPVTSIYSKSDGVVGWQSSIDVYNPQARNIEVKSSHFGIGIHGKVWRIIAETLAGHIQH
jgi:pimeloyl-ACP methyl ester carboxylesterase